MRTSKSSIILDHVTLENHRRFNYATACEDCTHFDDSKETCTFGFPTAPHLKRNQLQELEKTGTMAFCRAMEID